jgi:hypothetical protein
MVYIDTETGQHKSVSKVFDRIRGVKVPIYIKGVRDDYFSEDNALVPFIVLFEKANGRVRVDFPIGVFVVVSLELGVAHSIPLV